MAIDRYMFARGGLGTRRDLNFFVDSGLIAVQRDGDGAVRQASFTSSKRRLRQWGIPSADIRRGFVESRDPLTLGPRGTNRPLIVVGAAGDQNFGGVRIDGLISHAFLRRDAWTIDFDQREYTFAQPENPREAMAYDRQACDDVSLAGDARKRSLAGVAP